MASEQRRLMCHKGYTPLRIPAGHPELRTASGTSKVAQKVISDLSWYSRTNRRGQSNPSSGEISTFSNPHAPEAAHL
jgi:hypothetical protein